MRPYEIEGPKKGKSLNHDDDDDDWEDYDSDDWDNDGDYEAEWNEDAEDDIYESPKSYDRY